MWNPRGVVRLSGPDMQDLPLFDNKREASLRITRLDAAQDERHRPCGALLRPDCGGSPKGYEPPLAGC